MTEFVNRRTDELKKRLELEGKVEDLYNDPENWEATLEMNEEMRIIKRDSKYKLAKSEKSAENAYVNTAA